MSPKYESDRCIHFYYTQFMSHIKWTKAADVYISNVHGYESYQEVESGRCPLSTKAADVDISIIHSL